MATIADLIAAGRELGIFEFYLPFIIMFAIIYGLLNQAKIFGKDARNINLVIALSSALFVMIFTPVGPAAISMSTFLSNLFAGTLMVVVTIITFVIVIYVLVMPFKKDKELNAPKEAIIVVIFIGLILAAGVFISSGGGSIFPGLTFGTLPSAPTFFFPGISMQDLAVVIVVILTGVVIYYLTKGGESSTPSPQPGGPPRQ